MADRAERRRDFDRRNVARAAAGATLSTCTADGAARPSASMAASLAGGKRLQRWQGLILKKPTKVFVTRCKVSMLRPGCEMKSSTWCVGVWRTRCAIAACGGGSASPCDERRGFALRRGEILCHVIPVRLYARIGSSVSMDRARAPEQVHAQSCRRSAYASLSSEPYITA